MSKQYIIHTKSISTATTKAPKNLLGVPDTKNSHSGTPKCPARSVLSGTPERASKIRSGLGSTGQRLENASDTQGLHVIDTISVNAIHGSCTRSFLHLMAHTSPDGPLDDIVQGTFQAPPTMIKTNVLFLSCHLSL